MKAEDDEERNGLAIELAEVFSPLNSEIGVS